MLEVKVSTFLRLHTSQKQGWGSSHQCEGCTRTKLCCYHICCLSWGTLNPHFSCYWNQNFKIYIPNEVIIWPNQHSGLWKRDWGGLWGGYGQWTKKRGIDLDANKRDCTKLRSSQGVCWLTWSTVILPGVNWEMKVLILLLTSVTWFRSQYHILTKVTFIQRTGSQLGVRTF